METKETYLFLCPRGSWLRERLRQITKNITVECQITDILGGVEGGGRRYSVYYYSFY